MPACIEAVARAHAALARREAVLPVRTLMRPEPLGGGILGMMPGFIGGEAPLFGMKAVTVFHANAARGLPSHQGVILLFSSETGALEALVDAGEVTAIRTAAASAAAARILARKDARILAILGSGTQARTHLAAMAAVRDLAEARIWSRSGEGAARFAAESAGSFPFAVRAAPTAEEAVRGADLVVTVTASREPVLAGAWLSSGAHVSAVGACLPAARELDTDAVRRSSVFVDVKESALREAGDILIPIREGALTETCIRAELGDLVTGAHPGRKDPREITLYKSLGVAIQDLAAAGLALREACRLGVGTGISL